VIDRLLLKLPVLGDVLRKAAVSRFTRTLGTLIGSGVSILDGLEITARTAGEPGDPGRDPAVAASIAGGDTIAAPLAKSQVFPPMVISMIAVGEQTGGLDEMLTKIADFYDGEVDAAVSALLSLLEPLMIVVLGVVVGGMVVSMYLPIFDMMNAVAVRKLAPRVDWHLAGPWIDYTPHQAGLMHATTRTRAASAQRPAYSRRRLPARATARVHPSTPHPCSSPTREGRRGHR
jgi:hypothetical protein